MSLGRPPGQLFAALTDDTARRRPLRWCRCVLSLVLQVGVVVVLPLAAALVPDPLWIAGVYDGGDYDDLIAVFSDMSSPPRLLVDLRLAPSATAPAAPIDVTFRATLDCVDVHMRALPGGRGSSPRLARVVCAPVLTRAPPPQA